MNVVEFKKINGIVGPNIYYLKIEVTNLSKTLNDMLKVLSDLSWLSKFNEEYMKNSFKSKVDKTVNFLIKLFEEDEKNNLVLKSGEYIVSELSREAIVSKLNYLDIPLMELLGKKTIGNPGFDFITENKSEKIIIFGEAKYLSSTNAYDDALEQINDFISKSKDIEELSDMDKFCSKSALINADIGIKGFAAAFSVTNIKTDTLLKNIQKNQNFIKLLKYKEIILVGVCIKIL